MLAQEEMEVGLLVKDFFDGPVEAVLHFFLSRPRSTTALCMCMCMHVHVACMVACGMHGGMCGMCGNMNVMCVCICICNMCMCMICICNMCIRCICICICICICG